MSEIEAVALRAVPFYPESHPRPSSVTQEQAAEMAGVSRMTISRLVRAGKLKMNGLGRIPTAEVDRVISGGL